VLSRARACLSFNVLQHDLSFNVLQHDADPPVVPSEGDTMLEVMLLLLHVIQGRTLQSAYSDGCASVP
jgi:hypothetical protein